MGHSAAGPEKKPLLSELFRAPESLPTLLFILFFAILFGAGPELRSAKYVFEPPWLLFTLNSFFITGLCLLIAGLCFRSFLRGGFLNVLLLGCGVLTFGLSSFAAGWLIHPPYGPNYTVTTHNIGVLFTAVLYFLSSLFTAFGYSMEIERRRVIIAAAACSAVFLLGAVLTAETMRQVLPPFYIVGEGPTVIRQVVLAVSVTFLLTSALLMMTVYAERKTGFLLYSINALLLIGAGIVSVALAVPGSPLSWLGRAAQYLGDVYLAVASMKALGEARSMGTTVERALADFFRRSETHYRALIDMAADSIVAVDREGRIILMNPAAENIFGYHRGEALGRNLAELAVPEQSRDLFHACLSGQSRREMEMDLVRKDGSSFPAVLSCSPEIQSDGGSERTIIIRDVTDRRRAEEALRESETRFRTLAGATFEGIAITENGRITDINEQFCKISGFDRSELLGMDVSKLVHPDDRDRILDSIVTGRESMVEHRLIRKDGSLIIVEAHGKTVRHDGRDRRLTAVRDITEARKAEETIRGAALFPLQNPEPVMRIHRDGTLLFSNPAARPVLAEWRTAHETRFPDRVHQAVEAALNEGVSREFEMQTAGRVFSFVIAPIAAAAYANLYGWDVTESKRAVAALKESEARYRGLFESMHEGFALHELLCDENGEPCDYRFLDVNPSFEQQTGLKRKDVIGRTVREVLPDIEPHWIKRYGEVALTGTPAHFESHSSALGRDYDIFAYRPAPGQFAVIFMDITNRRRAEQSLRASYELLKIAQRAANAGLWAWDVSTGTLTWSEEFYKLFGLEPEASASFDTWLGVLHPDDRQPAMEKINRSVRERAPLENEYRINRPDGEERWIRVWGSTFYDENGQPLNMSGVCIDATESVRAEEALRASEMRMKAVADHLPVGVWFADETGKIIYGNEAGRRIWAGAHYVDPEEFHVYRAWWADTDKPLGPEDWAVSRAVRKGETSLNEVLEIECFDGTRKTILNSAVPLRSSDGSLQGVVVLNEDITERKEAEGALRQNEARFRLLSETAGRLLATDDPQGLINELCRDVMEHLDCQAFFNFMVDERAGRLRLNACAGIPEEEVRKLEWLDYGVAVCGCVARDNVRIIAEDIFHTPDVRTDLVRSYGIQAYCCHPLRAQDRLIGTLSFGTKTRARFTPEEVDVMRTVADQVAVALQRIRAQQEIRKSQEALRLVNEELEQRVRERTTELILLLEDLEKSRDDLRKLASELVLTEERERKKISVTLHDEVAQTLAAARMRIDLLRSKPVDDESRHALDEAQQLLVQAIRETRSLMTDISNPVLYDMGLRVAVQSLTEEVKARNGISFSSSFGGSLRTLGQDMEVMIFLVVKELVQNIVKHSGARNASIGIVEERDDIKVIVTDDGQGFDVGSVGAVGLDSGFGLFSIRERVKSYNGKIRIESAPGKGSEVTVLLPKKAAGSTASRKTRKRKEQA